VTSQPFTRIYRGNLWSGVESLSGPGSGSAATDPVKGRIVELVERLGVRSVLDVGCGDGFWMPDLPGYLGLDVVPQAIRMARKRHPKRLYALGTIHAMRPKAELVIIRDVIQHLPFAEALALLDAVSGTGAMWLLASTYRGGANRDIEAGDCYSPDLTAEPFSLPEPTELIPDGYAYHDGGGVRDATKYLGLWGLA
jgi:SAM-dependent methyltransferase